MQHTLTHIKDIPSQGSLIVQGFDGREIALFNVEDKIYALENACPHMGGPLGEGCLDKTVITCPWHGWSFDVRTGDNIDLFGDNAKIVKIEVKDGIVYEVRS